MKRHVDFNKYQEFVDAVTSKESRNYNNFSQRLEVLNDQGFPSQRLLTAAVGMTAESGEFTEVVKKIIFS